VAAEFDAMLRERERELAADPLLRQAPQPAPSSAATAPPPLGDVKDFKVCGNLTCSSVVAVQATARYVGTKVAVYIDNVVPQSDPLQDADAAELGASFDDFHYPIDTTAFGRESDLDGNGVVIVLMTDAVNNLTPDCTNGRIVGYFFGGDLLIGPANSNRAEIFFTLVPAPQTPTCSAISRKTAVDNLKPTLIHEFQHMISFNQHVLERGSLNGELLWLNEGFSHYAEELGGRSYELDPSARRADCTIGTTPCRFYVGNFLNAYDYLDTTSKHFLLPTEGIGTLTERGAAWLFVRYLVDQYATGTTTASWDTLTRSLVQTSRSGAANIEFVTGAKFDSVVSRWALANWVTDAPAAPPELKYESWNLHAVFSSLHTQRSGQFPKFYPLEPTVSAGRAVNLSGTLRSGSPIFHRATQQAGDPGFTLSFTAPSGGLLSSAQKPRLNVIRLQ
jgi:hypothetical protein